MNDDEEREVVQLWWAAEECFKLAEKAKTDLPGQDLLRTPVKQLADNCRRMSDITGTNEMLMRLNVHLASCAVRLYSIDELLGKYYKKSIRWENYEKLVSNNPAGVKSVLHEVIHILLRHNVAHAEREAKKKPSYEIIQMAFKDLTIGQLYDSMQQVRDEIKHDPKLEKLIQS